MQRITKSIIAKIDPTKETRERDIVDAEIRGFGIRIRPNTDPTFYFRYSSPKTKKIRRLSIGSVSGIELDTAREIAREYRGHIAKGMDLRCRGSALSAPPIRWQSLTNPLCLQDTCAYMP